MAGLLSWASGVLPYIKPFNGCLWAALTAHVAELEQRPIRTSKRKRPTHLFFILRVRQAIIWIRRLVRGNLKTKDNRIFTLSRWTGTAHRDPELTITIRTDASPTGMGAVLFQGSEPTQWIAIQWDESDHQFLRATPGEAAWQAEWELLAILVAVDVWLPDLSGRTAAVVQTDATAALFNVKNLSGKTPAMNALTAEIALRLESVGVETIPEHVMGTLNFECDALSREAQGATIPERLRELPRVWPPPRVPSWFWAWPRDLSSAARLGSGRPGPAQEGAQALPTWDGPEQWQN